MTDSGMLLVLDTNVWLDNYIPTRLGHGHSVRVIDLALSKGCTLGYAVGCVKDVFYMVAALLKAEARAEGKDITEAAALSIRECAWAVVDNMCEVGTAVGADGSDVWIARKLRAVHADFEDGMALAAARRAGADFLVTNDQKLIRHADCPAMTAEDMALYFEAMR